MRSRAPVVMLVLFTAALAACGGAPKTPTAFTSPSDGFRFELPPGWQVWAGEIRSPSGALLSTQVLSLENGDEAFIRELPASITPQLEEWARQYFRVVGTPVTRQRTLGGEPATEYAYPVRVRPNDGEQRVIYWVARHGSFLYVLRASLPKVNEAEAAGLESLLASWGFVEMVGHPEMPTGSFILAVPRRDDVHPIA